MTPEGEQVTLVQEALEIWESGGWGMIALAVIGFLMFGMGMQMMLQLLGKGIYTNPDRAWAKWRAGEKNKGSAMRVLEGARTCSTIPEVEGYFDSTRNDEVYPFERDLRFIKVTVSAAPLLGLLGTVTGMFDTFQALARGSGGDKTMDMVASGISVALITTMTGLVVALMGIIMQFMLTRMHNQYSRLLVHLEAHVMQACQRGELPGQQEGSV